MIPLETLLLFVSLAALLVVLPGPDFALIAKISLCDGRPQGQAAACGVAYMMLRQKGEQERIYQILCDTITNSIETLGGMVCDGAKASCAAKIGLAVENALMALELSLAGNVFQPGEGMTMEDPEDTIAAVGRMGRVGMKSTDVEILNIMLGN